MLQATTISLSKTIVSKILTSSKCNITELETIAYTVIMASRKLRHYFEAHKIRITTVWGLGDLFRNPEASIRIAKWAVELSSYNVTFEPRTAIKSQVLADFIVDWTRPSDPHQQRKEIIWTIHCNGAWCHAGESVAVIITSPSGIKYKLVCYPCVATAHNNTHVNYLPKRSQDFLSIFSALRIIFFYECTSTIGSKSETPIPRLPHIQGFVEQEGKGRGGHTCSLLEKDTMKAWASGGDIGSIPLDI